MLSAHASPLSLSATPAAPKAAPKASPVAPRSRPTRERKQVSRLTSEEPRKKAKLEIKAGAGAKLGDIPNVAFVVAKFKGKDDFLRKIHILLFRKPGTFRDRVSRSHAPRPTQQHTRALFALACVAPLSC